jgi:hypothetical protein
MHHHTIKFSHLVTAAAVVYTFCPMAELHAQTVSDRALSEVTTQTVGECTTMTIRFHGRVQLLSFFPQTSGRELNIRVRPLDAISLGDRESLRSPASVRALRSIEFEGDNASGPTLSLFFRRDVRFDVAAGVDPETILISVAEMSSNALCRPAANNDETWVPFDTADTAIAPAPTVAPAVITPAAGQVAAIPAGLYVVNILSQPNRIGELPPEKTAYMKPVSSATDLHGIGYAQDSLKPGKPQRPHARPYSMNFQKPMKPKLRRKSANRASPHVV